MAWEENELDSICELIADCPHSTPEWTDEGVFVIRSWNVRDGKLNFDKPSYTNEEIYRERIRRATPTEGDIVITREAPMGEVCQIPANLKCCLGQRLVLIRADSKKADKRFLLYSFQASSVQAQIKSHDGAGSTVSNLRIEYLEKLKIHLPPLPIQHRIAEVLGRYDALIENYQRQIGLLEALAQNLYREWFVRGRCPGVAAGDNESPIRLEEIVTTQYGFTASATDDDTGVKFLRITDISGNRIDWADVPYCEVSDDDFKKYELKAGDVVVARIGATAGYGKRIHKCHPKSVFASYLVRMQVKNPLHDYFVGMSVESRDFKDFINQTASGAAQPQANAPLLTNYEIKLPSEDALRKFNAAVEPHFDLIENLQLQIACLRQMRDKLLPRLMSGQLAVSCDGASSSR